MTFRGEYAKLKRLRSDLGVVWRNPEFGRESLQLSRSAETFLLPPRDYLRKEKNSERTVSYIKLSKIQLL